MKIITINGCRQAGTYDFKGLSTDEKPTDCGINSLFYELDTGDFYYFNGVWKKVSSKVQLQDTGPSGTIEITENGTVDVYNYDYADVNVPGVIPTGTLPITENGNVNVTNYASAEVDVDYVTVNFDLPALTRSTPTKLSKARCYLAATTVAPAGGSSPQSGYALFAGGYTGSYSDVVDAYDTNLTRTTPTVLSSGRFYLTATSVAPAGGSSPQSGYALFAGGRGVPMYVTVDAYDQTLTRTTPPALTQARDKLASTTVGNYALFGGGQTSAFSGYTDVVEVYDQSLTLQTAPAVLSQARRFLVAATVAPAGGSNPQSGYALFAGGNDGSSYFNVVDAYNETLEKVTSPSVLSEGVSNLAATSIAAVGGSSPQSGYALFGGGELAIVYTKKVNVYNDSLDKVTPIADLSGESGYLAATSIAPAGEQQSGYALFAGGIGRGYLNATDVYDSSLTQIPNPQVLSQGRYGLSATNVGGYALFGGGADSSRSNVVDAYSRASYDIQLLPDEKYSFNGSTELMSTNMQTITIEGSVVGYIKIKNTNVTGD